MSDSDSEDDVQDWRVLDAQVLKRGEKDHAPDGTLAQTDALQLSREAMYSALARPALAVPNKHTIEADWDAEHCRAQVRVVRGKYFATMGWAVRTTTYIWPEEVIYLAQRGSLLAYDSDVPLSLEELMARALPAVGASRMQVYSHLKRQGFVVRRVPENDAPPPAATALGPPGPSFVTSLAWLIAGNWFHSLAWKPVYATYTGVYRDLVAIRTAPLATRGGGKFDFHVWRPATKFKRSQPPPPDFRVRVVSADEKLDLPSMESCLALVPPVPSSKRSTVARMRDGCRSFLFAVVDNSVVSFVRCAETVAEGSVREPPAHKL